MAATLLRRADSSSVQQFVIDPLNVAGKPAKAATETVAETAKPTRAKSPTRQNMEAELARLRKTVKNLRDLSSPYDAATGLSNKAKFMELGAAEFNRTRRYGHNLTLVVATVSAYKGMSEKYDAATADRMMTAVAQVCVSSSRFGVDILGRTEDDRIALLLPETSMKGGVEFLKRMKATIDRTPIHINGTKVNTGMRLAARTLKSDHASFADLFRNT